MLIINMACIRQAKAAWLIQLSIFRHCPPITSKVQLRLDDRSSRRETYLEYQRLDGRSQRL